MANVVIDVAAEFTGKKAFKQAETSTDKLVKSTKKLAGVLGLAFATRAITNYSKTAVKAFADDQKAARALTLTLDNLGMAFANPEVTKFIANLETQFGVLDDQLRPAYQKLLTATGDYVKAQDLLRTSLDLSAQSGLDVQSVSADLARAYAGTTRGLLKYNLGLDKAQLAAMSFEDILKRIAIVSAGQAEAAADSYAGSIDRLDVALANASETIGKSLIDAIGTLAGGDGLPKTIALIETLSEGFSRAITLSARVIRNFSILASGNPLESLRDLREASRADLLADRKATAEYGGIYGKIYQEQAKVFANGKKTLSNSKALTKETAAQLKNRKLEAAIAKAESALGKGSDVFDMDKIQIAAAQRTQLEQLGKATDITATLGIANNIARLQVKQDIQELEDAITSGDEKAIIAATNKLNADNKILGALQNQETKVIDIKKALDALVPKDLINLTNLDEAIAKLKIIGAGAGTSAGTTAGSTAGTPSLLESLAAGSFVPVVAGTGGVMGGSSSAGAYASSGFPGSDKGSVNITVNTGIGDPNAIAEAIEQVVRGAVDRGTLRAS